MNNLSNERTAQYDRDFQAKGYSVWKVRVAGQEIIRNVTLADVRLGAGDLGFELMIEFRLRILRCLIILIFTPSFRKIWMSFASTATQTK